MATSFDKNEKSSRRAVADDVRRKQSRAERRKSFAIVVCVAVALLIIVAAAYRPVKNWWDLRQFRDIDLASIGAPAIGVRQGDDQAGRRQPAARADRVPGHLLHRPSAPAFGSHWNEQGTAPPFDRKFYTAEDSRRLETLVHNLEHGYTILWYDQMRRGRRRPAQRHRRHRGQVPPDSDNLRYKFIAAPWTPRTRTRAASSPTDARRALALVGRRHGVTDAGQPGGRVPVLQPAERGGLKDFMLKYPYTDSPEPGAA